MQWIKCPSCNHSFQTPFHHHCLCKACGRNIPSIPDAAALYLRTLQAQQALGGAPVRAPDGSPIPPPTPTHPRTPEKPRYVADDHSFIKRRMEQLQKEKTNRVVGNQPMPESKKEGF